MNDIITLVNNILNGINIKNDENDNASQEYNDNTFDDSETNITDPIVCHDPVINVEGITTIYEFQEETNNIPGNTEKNEIYDMTKIAAIEFPLVVINDRNINSMNIISMSITYNSFLPNIVITIDDPQQNEQRINTTQMSSIIKVCMISSIDGVYKKILLNFRVYDVKTNEFNSSVTTYYGTYYVEGFRQINTKTIYMDSICNGQNCNQGDHLNANTWEMLHKISELTGLGFAATNNCKEINDRLVRNIYSQRFDTFIEQQLMHSGTDENNIFDAWVDLYGYIVLVNVAWVMNAEIKNTDLSIIADVGMQGTSYDSISSHPEKVVRMLTNFSRMVNKSNLEISNYRIQVQNDSIKFGTLENVYSFNFANNLTTIDSIDIQTKQNSIDGEYIEEYNTGKNKPTPTFNFNDDKWTGLTGGYDIHMQQSIRTAYFRKLRQSILQVELKDPNFGLQRGTLVNILIFDNDPINKQLLISELENITSENDNTEMTKIESDDVDIKELLINDGNQFPNYKLSGLYYIDGMQFEYERNNGRIIQTLFLIKKGSTSGYENKHTSPKVDASNLNKYADSSVDNDQSYDDVSALDIIRNVLK